MTAYSDNKPALHAVHDTLDITLVSSSCATCFKLNNFSVLSTTENEKKNIYKKKLRKK